MPIISYLQESVNEATFGEQVVPVISPHAVTRPIGCPGQKLFATICGYS
jgi:hypothetical protein